MADENYTYFVTAQKSTSVTHAVSGAFTSATDLNLIVSKFLVSAGDLLGEAGRLRARAHLRPHPARR